MIIRKGSVEIGKGVLVSQTTVHGNKLQKDEVALNNCGIKHLKTWKSCKSDFLASYLLPLAQVVYKFDYTKESQKAQ